MPQPSITKNLFENYISIISFKFPRGHRVIISSSGLAYHTQDLLLYYPDQPSHSRLYVESPAAAGLPYENIYERAEDGVRINMYLVLQPASTRPNAHTVIYFHGNAGNIGHRYMMQGSQYG